MKIHLFRKGAKESLPEDPPVPSPEEFAPDEKDERQRFRLTWPMRCLLIVVLAMGVAVTAARLIEYRELQARKAELQRQIVGYEDHIAEMQEQLGEEMTREYIVRVAREKLHLYFPDDVIYYNNYNK